MRINRQIISYLFKISRPRFWLYLGGTYVIGYLAGMRSVNDIFSPVFIVHFIYFFIFANIFLYGVNDLYDQDTDQYNPKKILKENLHTEDKSELLTQVLFVIFLVSVLFAFYQPSNLSTVVFSLFVFLSYYYSAPPLRFKSKIFVDFVSNILYVLPGVLGFIHISGNLPSAWILFSLSLWAWAMHLFSAIPDISSDSRAGLKTSAVYLGYRPSLVLCTIFWSAFAFGIVMYSGLGRFSFLAIIYPIIPCLLLLSRRFSIDRIYWLFPVINGVVGFVLFWVIFFQRGILQLNIIHYAYYAFVFCNYSYT